MHFHIGDHLCNQARRQDSRLGGAFIFLEGGESGGGCGWFQVKPRYTSNKVHFRSSFGGKKKFEKAERRYTVFEHSNTPVLLEAGCRLM